MNLEQIAFRIAEEVFGPSPRKFHAPLDEECANFARRLVAELTKGREPVAALQVGANPRFVDCIYRGVALPADQLLWPEETRIPRGTSIRLYATPPICPTTEWQLVPKVATGAMWMALDGVAETEDAREDCQNMWTALLAAAPEYKEGSK